MTDITYSLTIGGQDLDCHALQSWRVTAGRDDDITAPKAGSGTFTLVYDGGGYNAANLNPGALVEFDATVAGRTVPIARHYLSTLDRDFSWEAPDGRNRVTIKTTGKFQSLARKLMAYAPPFGNRGRLPTLTPGGGGGAVWEPLYVPGEAGQYSDGVRCWQVVTAAGHTIEAPSDASGAPIINDGAGSDQWPTDATIVSDTDLALHRKTSAIIPANDTYRLEVSFTAFAGDNTIDVRPRIGTVTGDWQSLNSVTGFDQAEWDMNLTAGTHAVVIEYRGTPPPLTWDTAAGVTQSDGDPAVAWGDADDRMTWGVHRGLLWVEEMTLTDTTGAGEWGTALISKRDTQKDTPNEPVSRQAYVEQVTACCRSVVFETRHGDPEFVFFPRRGTANAAPRVLTVDACDLAVGTSSQVGGWRMTNDVTWSYGEERLVDGSSDRHTVRVTNAGTTDLTNDMVQVNHDGPISRESDARAIATWVLNTYDSPREDLSAVESIPLQKLDADTVVDMLAADCGQLLTITNTPAAWISSGADWTGYIEGHELVGTPSDTRLTFKLTAKEK